MKNTIGIFFFSLCFSFSTMAQDSWLALEDSIDSYAEMMLTDTSLEKREASADKVMELLKEAFAKPGSYDYDFTGIQRVSIQKSPDDAFRIATYQLFIDDKTYRYYGLVQQKNGSITELADNSDDFRYPERFELAADRWYGALYYKIVPFKQGRKKMYAVLGFDAFSFFNRRKVIEIIHFDKNEVKFGAPIIEVKNNFGQPMMVYRFLIEYSAEVAVGLNYRDDEDLIVYDHLITAAGFNGTPVNVPDGTYCGYRWEKNKWVYVERLFDDAPILFDGQAPIPEPKEKDGKGLFGE